VVEDPHAATARLQSLLDKSKRENSEMSIKLSQLTTENKTLSVESSKAKAEAAETKSRVSCSIPEPRS